MVASHGTGEAGRPIDRRPGLTDYLQHVDDSVEVRLFAAARAAAGRREVRVPAGSLADVLDAVLCNVTPNAVLNEVLARSSFLLDEVAVHGDRAAIRVAPGARVDVLPPFAGG